MPAKEVPQSILERFKKVSAATVFGAVRRKGWDRCWMEDVYTFTPSKRLAARARTLRFLPPRPDLKAEIPPSEKAPEYIAMGMCAPGDVLVVDAMGMPYCGIGGDVKFLQLQMNRAEGIVTDGAIRDLDAVKAYGLILYARRRTPGIGEPLGMPYQANVDIQCAGVLVRPGDIIVGDDDGVVVVPSQWAEDVVGWCEEHEGVEVYIKDKIQRQRCAPGRYYPPTDATIEEFRKLKKAPARR